MIEKKIFVSITAFFYCFMLMFAQCAMAEEKLTQVPALIQISSKVSDGRLELSQIVATAKKSGMKEVIFTDRDIMRWNTASGRFAISPKRRLLITQ